MRASGRQARGEVRTLLAILLREVGPERFFALLADLGDGLIFDTRPLFAHLAPNLTAADRYTQQMIADAPKDADALYNAGLIAQKQGDYNAAREAYLAVLKADPNFAVARYNLAVLTWQRGVKAEAVSHVRRFLDDYPDDPRGASLSAMVGGVPAPETLPPPRGR